MLRVSPRGAPGEPVLAPRPCPLLSLSNGVLCMHVARQQDICMHVARQQDICMRCANATNGNELMQGMQEGVSGQ